MSTGIIIGRFQTPYLHPGHLWLISTALRECDDVVILLGCQSNTDIRNPYLRMDRVRMIKRIFPQVEIIALWDNNSDEEWSKHVDMLCDVYLNPILYHSRDSFVTLYKGKYPTKEVPEIEGFSATKIRNNDR